MVKLIDKGAWLINGETLLPGDEAGCGQLPPKQEAAGQTIAWRILQKHNISGDSGKLRIKFDALTSHDITYVGIIQTARACGLKEFPLPYILTNCHNSLCAVGGTINADDHIFGLDAAKRYGGIFVPPHMGVIHQYMREMHASCGKMILGSDSHTRYGALGTLAVGEGGPELVKQLLGMSWDSPMPRVTAVYLHGRPRPGVGPQDVALALIGAVFPGGFVKNNVLEFVGPGVSGLSMDFRMGIDVMTTETACLSSIWRTDEKTRDYLRIHGREEGYERLEPGRTAWYDSAVDIDLASIEPMIALPFHPSNVFSIAQLMENAEDILHEVEEDGRRRFGEGVDFRLRNKLENGVLRVEQGVIAGCAGGGFENICAAADILRGRSTGSGEFSLSVYPASQPLSLRLGQTGVTQALIQSGAVLRTAFCGPCFGAGDTPANGELSIRHCTRNFPNREGSKPGEGQIASVALMDARSIAATAANGGILTAADRLDVEYREYEYVFDRTVYDRRCWFGFGRAQQDAPLRMGPNIRDWPEMQPLAENLLLTAASVILDPVTTTDELIPSGETSSLRSNPLRLAEFALSRRDPGYVGRAKAARQEEERRLGGCPPELKELKSAFGCAQTLAEGTELSNTAFGSFVYARRPGDGSAREQAASSQRVLGGLANVAGAYATKRYRSNLVNWGMLPFVCGGEPEFSTGSWLFIPGIRRAMETGAEKADAWLIDGGAVRPIELLLPGLEEEERKIILCGGLINYYRDKTGLRMNTKEIQEEK